MRKAEENDAQNDHAGKVNHDARETRGFNVQKNKADHEIQKKSRQHENSLRNGAVDERLLSGDAEQIHPLRNSLFNLLRI